jgi:hypothetical protein
MSPPPCLLAAVADTFPPACRPEALLPPDAVVRPVSTPEDLRNLAGVEAVVLYATGVSAPSCPAARFLERLRLLPTLPDETRALPALILGELSAEQLLRLDPRFLVLLSPGSRYIAAPFTPDRVAEALELCAPAEWGSLAAYLDIPGRLSRLRSQARHGIANYLGPHTLLASACAAGAIPTGRFQEAERDLLTHVALSDEAREYASLAALARPPLAAGPGGDGPERATEWLTDLPGSRLRMLLLDDDHRAGWPRALAAVLGLEPVAAARTDVPVASFRLGTFRLDCWQGDDLNRDLDVLLGRPGAGARRWEYDAVFLDLRLEREAPEVPVALLSGYKALERLHEVDPSAQVVLFTASHNAVVWQNVSELGISGYYVKDEVLPDPASTNWARLAYCVRRVIDDHHRRLHFWTLEETLRAVQARSWFRAAAVDDQEKLANAVHHLQALLTLHWEGPAPAQRALRLHRHLIDAGHSILDTALRIRFPQVPSQAYLADLIKAYLGGLRAQKSAAVWLNDVRNAEIHGRPGRFPIRRDRKEVAEVVSAACFVASEEAQTGREALELLHRDRPDWPDWLGRAPRGLAAGDILVGLVTACARKADGTLKSLILVEDTNGERLRVADLHLLPPAAKARLVEGCRLRVRVTSVRVRPPQAAYVERLTPAP